MNTPEEIMISTHAIPSRMTCGQMLEKLLSSVCETTQLDDKSFVDFYQNYFTKSESDTIYNHLFADVDWRTVTRAKATTTTTYQLPRLQCWMSDDGVVAQLYQTESAMPWSLPVKNIKNKLEDNLKTKFDYVLMNNYRDGNDSISFHCDDEAEEEGKNVIASLSFGSTRTFVVKHRKDKKIAPIKFELTHGSLIVMRGDMQLNWVHSIPKDPNVKTPRINLTFRKS